MAFRERVKLGGRTAVVLGGTGATGRKVIEELVSRDEWTRVVAVGRRPVEISSDKVENYVVDLGKEEVDPERLRGCGHFFNCVGTTRAAAGGAEGFHNIEVGISAKVAAAAKAGGVATASVISAQGANADACLAPRWFHPLFYGKTMGLKERAMTDSKFARVTVFRPGMLKRGQTDRPMERIFGGILPSLDVALLAKAMVNDAEGAAPVQAGEPEAPLVISGNSKITELAKL